MKVFNSQFWPGGIIPQLLAPLILCLGNAAAQPAGLDAPLSLPPVGKAELRIIKPDLLELNLITTKGAPPARPAQWNFVAANFQYALPGASKFVVTADGSSVSVDSVGFKRRPIYAAARKRDLRIGNQLYLKLSQPIQIGQKVTVKNPDGSLWSEATASFEASFEPLRFSPAIHVNQVGYIPGFAKKAMIGYYAGTFGELELPNNGFTLVESASGKVVFTGNLVLRQDVGYTYVPVPYQKVYEADFSTFNSPGEYRIVVPDLGASYPFRIDEGAAAAYARTYALGLYHQRCGTNNILPYTRFTHEVCHSAPAEVPNDSFTAVNKELADFSANFAQNLLHIAPQLKKVSAALYPFINQGKVDVSGGHHDAGDYSKYTINSAQLVHTLIFAVDNYPGVAALDNLGLPESGDGISDLLQEAKWESDFLAKMQDADGGFYFLVYPRNRAYEDNVLPDRGDGQVVFPKTTAATAAAVAALAQTASSPAFKQAYPEVAAGYLVKARKGWAFLQAAFAKFGRNGSYQKISHYGDEFMHNDEIVWAATELFLATGDHSFENEVIGKFDPTSREFLDQGWIRLWEGYGAATRSYAFAARSGRITPENLNTAFVSKCESALLEAADEQVRFSQQQPYGSSFPDPNKTFRTAAWYFSVNQVFDLPAAAQLQNRAQYQDTILFNMNYEGGCNPVNVSFLTGVGLKRPREIVHQYSLNDRRLLPPSGIPLGNIQRGFQTDLQLYPNELSVLTFPYDYASIAPYAPYDTWGDAYNLITEFVVPQLARSLAATASLMAQTSLKTEPWKASAGRIDLSNTTVQMGEECKASLQAEGLDLAGAQLVWEARNEEPILSPTLTFTPALVGRYWVEAEAMFPDGRRVFAASEVNSTAVAPKITSLIPNQLRVSGTSGQSFTIQASNDLQNWANVASGTFGSEPFEWLDEDAIDLASRFYRVVAGL